MITRRGLIGAFLSAPLVVPASRLMAMPRREDRIIRPFDGYKMRVMQIEEIDNGAYEHMLGQIESRYVPGIRSYRYQLMSEPEFDLATHGGGPGSKTHVIMNFESGRDLGVQAGEYINVKKEVIYGTGYGYSGGCSAHRPHGASAPMEIGVGGTPESSVEKLMVGVGTTSFKI